VPFWSKGEVFQIGEATFIHGRFTNEYHAKKHATRYGNVFYGHTHDIQSFSGEFYGSKTIIGQSLGVCACRKNINAARPTNGNKPSRSSSSWMTARSAIRWSASPITGSLTAVRSTPDDRTKSHEAEGPLPCSVGATGGPR
jgi:hypothetical protein